MGICKHCRKDIVLKDGEKNCPNCNLPPYNCWNCGESISGETKECSVCHFFICSKCNVCGMDCNINTIYNEVKDLPQREMIEKIYNYKNGKIRLNCYRDIPISYAKVKLGNMTLKLKGKRCSEDDRKAFNERLDILTSKSIGTQWTISEVKEIGNYGIEMREASNMLVCSGLAIKKTINREINNKKVEFDIYEKTQIEPCIHMNTNNLVKKKCKKCGLYYNDDVVYCTKCIYKKGKNKGNPVPLIDSKSNICFCQLPRKEFKEMI